MNLKMNEVFILDTPLIDQVGESVEEILSLFKVERKLVLKVKLTVEDLLLSVVENSSSPRNFRFLFHKRLSNGSIQLEYDGSPFNPLTVKMMSLQGSY